MFRSGAHGTTALRGLRDGRDAVRFLRWTLLCRNQLDFAIGRFVIRACFAGVMRADRGICCGLACSSAGRSRLVSAKPKPSCIGCARYGKRYESPMFAVYSVGTCMDEDSGAHHRGRQRRVSSAERTRTASALIPFRASWLKAGRGKRGRFSRPWRRPSVIGANEAGGSRRCASVNQGGTARAFSRPWTG